MNQLSLRSPSADYDAANSAAAVGRRHAAGGWRDAEVAERDAAATAVSWRDETTTAGSEGIAAAAQEQHVQSSNDEQKAIVTGGLGKIEENLHGLDVGGVGVEEDGGRRE